MILTGTGIISSRSCPAELISTSNLEIYYNLNGNALDSSGQGNNGTPSNMVFVENGMFSGAGDFLTASSRSIAAPQKAYGIATAFTLAIWLKTSTTSGSGLPQMFFTADRLISGDATNSARIWQFRLDDVTSFVRFVRFNASGGVVTNIAGSTSLSDGKYHHIAATFSTTNGSVVYVDGTAVVTSATLTANANRSNTKPFLGCGELGAAGAQSNFFTGELDEAILFTRELTAAQIQDLARGTCPLKA